ncbi:MAG: hypothetical protein QOH66_8 [Actinomycetota bacterium]|nr:hypothetical protein [Actinomycetota bacterium]
MHRRWFRSETRWLSTVLAVATLATATGYPLANAVTASTTCSLGNGAQHVVQITFDNVHFFRDNPNVPSDLEQMPHLLNFIENNGTMLSNNHTPLIAHTANDSLTNYTGLYGDRHGMGISNSYRYFTPSGTANLAGSFVYWTNPIIDDATATPSTTDHNPSMIYSAQVPAKAVTSTATGVAAATPAPWVPFTRAGCNVGDTSTANMVLENTGDIPQVFGPTSPEAAQLAADVTDTFKDQETNDYIGVSIHCGTGAAAATCANAQAVKYGQTSPSPTAVADRLPDEPGGYNGFQAVHGHRYVAPVVGAGTPNLVRNGYQITNAAGNLVDLTGREIDGQFLHTPGFPGFGPISAPQTLAYMADMQESGVQVTYGYIADLHANNNRRIVGGPCLTAKSGALGPADPCYEANAAYYDAAFQTFFNRLAADGITPANTLFVFTADEGDHFPGANVGRAITPACTGTPGTTSYTCSYPAGTLGELNTNLTGLLATETGKTTPFALENDSAPQFYVNGQPGATDPITRQLERDVASLKANNPYTSGASNVSGTGQPVANYLADPVAERILHFVDADPNRTPTFSLFAKPDHFLSAGSTTCPATPPSGQTATGNPCVTINPSFAWNHGDYAPEINTTWLGLAGAGVARKGLDGSGAASGPSSAGPNSGQGTIPGTPNPGTWADHTDIRPTMLSLLGLRDDYPTDGRVLAEDLAVPSGSLGSAAQLQLAQLYKQLNSSVGQFGTDTLIADTAAIRSGTSSDDATYQAFVKGLEDLANLRDVVATGVKTELDQAAHGTPANDGYVAGLTAASQLVLALANALAAHPVS